MNKAEKALINKKKLTVDYFVHWYFDNGNGIPFLRDLFQGRMTTEQQKTFDIVDHENYAVLHNINDILKELKP